jgi:2,3-dihydroxybenzoate decarboxylase
VKGQYDISMKLPDSRCHSVPFNLWRASHWINHPFKRNSRPMKYDYSYYWTHNVSITTSGNYNTRGLKFCIEELGLDRCLYAIGE